MLYKCLFENLDIARIHLDKYTKIGKTLYNDYQKDMKDIILNSTLSSGNIDAAIIEEMMFPKVETDIFLSHSHDDLDLAYAIAGFMKKEYDKIVFIDSAYWGSVYDLSQELSNTYSKTYSGYIDYKKHEYISTRTSMLLIASLSSMIRRSNEFWLLNTSHSINNEISTYSPWIYYEIYEAYNIYKDRNLEDHIIKESSEGTMPLFVYNVEKYLNCFKEKNINQLILDSTIRNIWSFNFK